MPELNKICYDNGTSYVWFTGPWSKVIEKNKAVITN